MVVETIGLDAQGLFDKEFGLAKEDLLGCYYGLDVGAEVLEEEEGHYVFESYEDDTRDRILGCFDPRDVEGIDDETFLEGLQALGFDHFGGLYDQRDDFTNSTEGGPLHDEAVGRRPK